jgi:light-regulated signal transduction histidine kinase (bacteriophytochrome)
MTCADPAKKRGGSDSPPEVALESRLAAAERELANARRDLDAFVGAVSHDLQAPLRHVRAFAELLARHNGAALDQDGSGYLEFVRNGAVKAQDMVSALVSYARLTSRAKPFRPLEVGACVARAVEALREEIARSGAHVDAGGMPRLCGDAEQLTMLFFHLLRNALRFCREGEPARATVRAERCEEGWRFEVRDNGVGMAPGFLERAFLPFQKADPNSNDLGMGLAVCRRIVERHGGRIWADSHPGQGSTFFFTLPALSEDGTAERGSVNR